MIYEFVAATINGTIEIAEPERFRLADLVQQYLNKKQDSRKVVSDVNTSYFGAALNDQSLVPIGDNPILGKVTFDSWFHQQTKAA